MGQPRVIRDILSAFQNNYTNIPGQFKEIQDNTLASWTIQGHYTGIPGQCKAILDITLASWDNPSNSGLHTSILGNLSNSGHPNSIPGQYMAILDIIPASWDSPGHDSGILKQLKANPGYHTSISGQYWSSHRHHLVESRTSHCHPRTIQGSSGHQTSVLG